MRLATSLPDQSPSSGADRQVGTTEKKREKKRATRKMQHARSHLEVQKDHVKGKEVVHGERLFDDVAGVPLLGLCREYPRDLHSDVAVSSVSSEGRGSKFFKIDLNDCLMAAAGRHILIPRHSTAQPRGLAVAEREREVCKVAVAVRGHMDVVRRETTERDVPALCRLSQGICGLQQWLPTSGSSRCGRPRRLRLRPPSWSYASP